MQVAQSAEVTSTGTGKVGPWRILGAGLFGIVLTAFVTKAAGDTIPRVVTLLTGTSEDAAKANYENGHSWLSLIVMLVTVLVAGFLAGTLSKRHGVIAGLLGNALSLGPLTFILYQMFLHGVLIDAPIGISSAKVEFTVLTLALFVMSVLSGLIGEAFYEAGSDKDDQARAVTVFGIRWWHLLWIFPVIYFPYLCTIIIVLSAWVYTLLKDVSYAWHPSLWFSLSAWFWLFVGLFAAAFAVVLVAQGLLRFQETLRLGSPFVFSHKLGRVILYGIGAPALAYFCAQFSIVAARSMPTPAHGDWKIAVGGTLLLILLGLIGSAYEAWNTRRRATTAA